MTKGRNKAVRLAMAAVLAALLTGFGGAASAGDGVPLPKLAKPQGERCIAPKDEMRRNHMDMLKHQRDLTMRDGVRGAKASWRGCVECHAAADPKVAGGKVRTLVPFCAECHRYAGVHLDCVQCHITVPEADLKKAAGRDAEDDSLIALIKGHLGEGDAR